MQHQNWQCPKCTNREFEVGQMRYQAGIWSKLFEVTGSKMSTVTCNQCKYTELYKTDGSAIENVLDFLVS